MDLNDPELNCFVPSEVARLVLGYLKANNMNRTINTFLRECPHLREYMQLLSRGVVPATDIMGYSLTEMLNGFAAVVLANTRSTGRTLTVSSTLGTMRGENEQHKHLRKNPAPGARKHVSLQGTGSHSATTLTGGAPGNSASVLVNPSEAQNHSPVDPSQVRGHNILNPNEGQGHMTSLSKESYLSSSVRSTCEDGQTGGAGQSGAERAEMHSFNTSGNENFDFLDRLLEDTQLPQLLAENINKALHVSPASSGDGAGVSTASAAPTSTREQLETNTVMKTTEARMDNIIEMTESDPAFHSFLKVFHSEAPTFGLMMEDDHSKDGFRTTQLNSSTQDQMKESSSGLVSKEASSLGNRESCITPVVNPDGQKTLEAEGKTDISDDVHSTPQESSEAKAQSSAEKEGDSAEEGGSPAKGSNKDDSTPADAEKDQTAGSSASTSIIPESSSRLVKPPISPDENSLSVFSLISKNVAEMSGEVYPGESCTNRKGQSVDNSAIDQSEKEGTQQNLDELPGVTTSKSYKRDLNLNSDPLVNENVLRKKITLEPEHSGKSSSAGFSPMASIFTSSGVESSDATSPVPQRPDAVCNSENSSKNGSEIMGAVGSQAGGMENHHNAELPQDPGSEPPERDCGNRVTETPSSETENIIEVVDVSPTTIEQSWEKVDCCLTSCLRSIQSGRDLQSLHAPDVGPSETDAALSVNQTAVLVEQTENGNTEEDPETSFDSEPNGVDGGDGSVSTKLVKQCRKESENSTPRSGQQVPRCLGSEEKKMFRIYNTLSSPPRVFKPQPDKNSPREIRARSLPVQDHCASLPASLSSGSRKGDKSQNFYPGLPNGKSSAFTPVSMKNQVNSSSKPNNSHPTDGAHSTSPPRSEQKTVISFSCDLSPVIPAHCRKAPTRRIKPVEVSYSTPSPLQEYVPPSPMDLVIDFQASPAATPGHAHFMSPRDSNGSNSDMGPPALSVDNRKNRSPHGESSGPGSITPKQRRVRVSTRKPKLVLPARSLSYVDGSSLTSLGIKLPASPSRRKPRRIVPTLLSSSIPIDSSTSLSSPLKPEDSSHMDDAKTVSSSSDVSSNFSPLDVEAFRQLKSFLSSSYSKPQPPQEITSTISEAAESSDKLRTASNEVSKCGCASREVCRHLKGRNRKNRSPKKRNPQSDPILLKKKVETFINAKTMRSKAASSEPCVKSPKEKVSCTIGSPKKRIHINPPPKLQDLGTCSADTAVILSTPIVTSSSDKSKDHVMEKPTSDKSKDRVIEKPESYCKKTKVKSSLETGEVLSARTDSMELDNDQKTDCSKTLEANSKSLSKETRSFASVNSSSPSRSSSPASCHSFAVVGTVERPNSALMQSPEPASKEGSTQSRPSVIVSTSSQACEKRRPMFSFINKLRLGFSAEKLSGNALSRKSVSDPLSKELDSEKKTREDGTGDSVKMLSRASSHKALTDGTGSQACDSEMFLSKDGSKVEEDGGETSEERSTVKKGKTEDSRIDGHRSGGLQGKEERKGDAVKGHDEKGATSEGAGYKSSGRGFEKQNIENSSMGKTGIFSTSNTQENQVKSPPCSSTARRIIFSSPEKASESMNEHKVEISRKKSVESISSLSHTGVSLGTESVPSTTTVLGQSQYAVSTPVTYTTTTSNCQIPHCNSKSSFNNQTVQTVPQDLNVPASLCNYAKGTFSALMSSSVSASDIETSPVYNDNLSDCLSGALRLANGIESHEFISQASSASLNMDGSPSKRTYTELKPLKSSDSSRASVVNSPCSGSQRRQAMHLCNTVEGSSTELSPSQPSMPTLSSFASPVYANTLQTAPVGAYNQTSSNIPVQNYLSTPVRVAGQGLHVTAQQVGHANPVKILPKLGSTPLMQVEQHQLQKLSDSLHLKKIIPRSIEPSTLAGLPSTPLSGIVMQQTPTGSVIVLPPDFNLFQAQSCTQAPNATITKRDSNFSPSTCLDQKQHSSSLKSKSSAVEKGEKLFTDGNKHEQQKISKTKPICRSGSQTNNVNPSPRTSEKGKSPKNKSTAISDVDQKQKQKAVKICEKLKPDKKVSAKGKSKVSVTPKSPSGKKSTSATSVNKKVKKREISKDLSYTVSGSVHDSEQCSTSSNSAAVLSGKKTSVTSEKERSPKVTSGKGKVNENKLPMKSKTSEKSRKTAASEIKESSQKDVTPSGECFETQNLQSISHSETAHSRKKGIQRSERKQTPKSACKKKKADLFEDLEISVKSTTESKRRPKKERDKTPKLSETETESKYPFKKCKGKADPTHVTKDVHDKNLEENNVETESGSELKKGKAEASKQKRNLTTSSNSSAIQSPCYFDSSGSKLFTNDPPNDVSSGPSQLFMLSDDSCSSDDIFLGNKKRAEGPWKNKVLRSDDEAEIDIENSSSSVEDCVSTWRRKEMGDLLTAGNSLDKEMAGTKSLSESASDGEPPAKRGRKESEASASDFERYEKNETRIIGGKEIRMTVDNESGALVMINPVLFDMFDSIYMRPSPQRKRKRHFSSSREDSPLVLTPPQQQTEIKNSAQRRVNRKISLEDKGKTVKEKISGDTNRGGQVWEPQRLKGAYEADVKRSNSNTSTLESLGATYINSVPVDKLKLLLEAGDATRTFVEVTSESGSASSRPKANCCIEKCKGEGGDCCVNGSHKRKTDKASLKKQRLVGDRRSTRKVQGALASSCTDRSSNSKTRSGKTKQCRESSVASADKPETTGGPEFVMRPAVQSETEGGPDTDPKRELLGSLDLQETETAVAALRLSMGENSVSMDWFALAQHKPTNEVCETGNNGDKFNSGAFPAGASKGRQHKGHESLERFPKVEESLHSAIGHHSFSKGHSGELGSETLQSSLHAYPQRDTESLPALPELPRFLRHDAPGEGVHGGTASGGESCTDFQESPCFFPQTGPSLLTSSTPGPSLLTSSIPGPSLVSSSPGPSPAASSTPEPSLQNTTSSTPDAYAATTKSSGQPRPASANGDLKLMLKKKKKLLEKLH